MSLPVTGGSSINMAAAVKFDDGTGAFVNNCFPVRSIIKYVEQGIVNN